MKIYENVKSRGLKMMFWGDIILNHPEYAKKLPKDVIALNWGYDANDVSEESCKCFQQAGVPYYVCPGTSAWNSIWGMTDKMMSNIRTSAYNGLKYGAVDTCLLIGATCGICIIFLLAILATAMELPWHGMPVRSRKSIWQSI